MRKFPAVILAGGRSRRMGRDKTLADLGGRPMLETVIERLAPQVTGIVLNAPSTTAPIFGLPLVPDGLGGQIGPLAGILAALRDTAQRHPDASHILSVPADSPFFPSNLAERLAASLQSPDEIAVAASGGRMHPVFALWPMTLACDLETWLADPENRRMTGFIVRHPNTTVDFPMFDAVLGAVDPFFNVNTPEDLEQAQKIRQNWAP